MTCPKCNEKFSANWRSPAPGGYSSPGEFFIFNILMTGCIATAFFLDAILFSFVLMMCLVVGFFANVTSWMDSNCHMGPNGERFSGLCCPRCREVITVYPWSL